MTQVAGCPLCEGEGGRLVLRTPRFRVIHATEAGFPGFYRLVWNDHVAEFSDLAPVDRAACMEAVAVIEAHASKTGDRAFGQGIAERINL